MLHDAILWEEGMMVAMFWRKFQISDVAKLIKEAWDTVKQSNLQNAWKEVCPQPVCAPEETTLDEVIDEMGKTVDIVQCLEL